jgi:hypothetical protein
MTLERNYLFLVSSTEYWIQFDHVAIVQNIDILAFAFLNICLFLKRPYIIASFINIS